MITRLLGKIGKIALMVLLIGLGLFYTLVYLFIDPMSDKRLLQKFSDANLKPTISYVDFQGTSVRVIKMKKEFDTLLPVLLFVHGSPGSLMDFQRYLKDSTLNRLANMMSYDRIGYGVRNKGRVLSSLEEELRLLDQLTQGIDREKILLAGYSYGGTLVMASDKKYKKKIALAAAVVGELEPQFWAMQLTDWKLTRPLIPKVFLAASEEKTRHVSELPLYSDHYNESPTFVLSIHGKEDQIVPFENSLYLQNHFESNKFELIQIEDEGHSLIWTNFELIKEALVKSLQE